MQAQHNFHVAERSAYYIAKAHLNYKAATNATEKAVHLGVIRVFSEKFKADYDASKGDQK